MIFVSFLIFFFLSPFKLAMGLVDETGCIPLLHARHSTVQRLAFSYLCVCLFVGIVEQALGK